MATIITRSANLAALNATQHDNNLDTVCGICTEDATGTYTIAVTDQNKTLEFSNATANAVTLPAIASITGSINTSDWKVTLKTVGAGDTTISTTTAIDGSASAIVLKQYESITIQTNDARDGWNIIARDVLPLDLSTYDPAAIAEQVVGLTATQTLTNKTLEDPVINVAGTDAEGDIYYRNSSGVFTRLAAGTAGQVLQTNGVAAPSWVTTVESSAEITIFAAGSSGGTQWDSTNANTSNNHAHGLSATPTRVTAWLECTTTQSPWAVGDRVYINSFSDLSNTTMRQAFSINADATNVWGYSWSGNTAQIMEAANGTTSASLLKSSWKLMCKAFVD